MTDDEIATELLARLGTLAFARDRVNDREVRTITITDDEAKSLLTFLATYSADSIA